MKEKKYTLKEAQKDLPQRGLRSHKKSGGKTLIFAGSQGMWGAAVLCAKGAARCGAGYVYLVHDQKTFSTLKNPDFLSLSKFPNDLRSFQAIAIGPGLAPKISLRKKIVGLSLKQTPPLVLDAEALNQLASLKKSNKLPAHWVLTPHEGEMARLLARSSQWVKKNRRAAVIETQKKWGGVVLLKGHESLICDGKNIFTIQSGNPSLAKAGTGDVLTGMIVAFLSQGLNPVKATCLGTFIHGKMADDWVKSGKDHLSLMPSDLIEQLPLTLINLRKKTQRNSI